MKNQKFVHLNVHSQYSIQDGCATIQQLVDNAIKNRMSGMAITDTGNMYGIMEFFVYVSRVNQERKVQRKKPFKPILGCELYVTGVTAAEDSGQAFRLTVLAKNLVGYQNMMKLVSLSDNKHLHHKELETYHEGLIVCSGGESGEVYGWALKGDEARMQDAIKWYQQVFADDYYLELRRTAVHKDARSEQEKVDQMLIKVAKENGVKLVGTNDVHYVAPEDLVAYNTQRCIALGTTIEEYVPNHPVLLRWLRSRKEMCELFADVPEAVANTIEILNKVEIYDICRTPSMHVFPVPNASGEDLSQLEADYLENLTFTKARQIYGDPLPEEVLERLQYELDTIKKKDASGYFLFMQDLVHAAESELGLWVGPGRGSSAGSLVAYCLGINKIDPLQYGLLFERFLNPDRTSFPDIDLDFEDGGRERVIEWLEKKYGKEHCAHIISFQIVQLKITFKNISNIKKCSIADTNTISNLGIFQQKTILDALNRSRALKLNDGTGLLIIQTALQDTTVLDVFPRRIITSYCGFVICDEPIISRAPIVTVTPRRAGIFGNCVKCVQYDAQCVESAGLVKVDFFDWRRLSQMKAVCEKIKSNHGVDFDIEKIPMDDPKSLELFQQRQTNDIFLFSSEGMRSLLLKMHPTSFEDLVILNAMYRTDLLDELPTLIKQKNGKKKIKYVHPIMEKYLQETYGMIVYQEQIMQLSQAIAGFSRGESDELRRAIARKNIDVCAVLKSKFVEGGIRNGYTKRALEKVWKEFEDKGACAFNKSHAVCYTWIAYQMAYLKANYPVEFQEVMKDDR